MAALTLASTWTPQSCPAGTEVWEIFFSTSAVWFQLGPITATSNCAPPGYNPTVPYNAYSCPSGYTSACTQRQNPSVTICCPTALSMACASSPWTISTSYVLSCGSTFAQQTAMTVTTTSIFGPTNAPGSSWLVTFTANRDAVGAFGIEYVAIPTSTSSSSSPSSSTISTTTPPPTSPSYPSPSSITTASSHSDLSQGASAGIGVGTAVGVLALAAIAWLLWRHGVRTGRRSAQIPLPPAKGHMMEPYEKPELVGSAPVARLGGGGGGEVTHELDVRN